MNISKHISVNNRVDICLPGCICEKCTDKVSLKTNKKVKVNRRHIV